MAKLTRYLQKIFANNSNQVGVFGTGVDKETSKNVETLQSADYEEGWSSAIITNKNYPIWQERDGVDYGFSYQLAYLMQAGIPEWLSTETYYTNSFCRYGNDIYYSLQDNNTNHNPALNDGWWIIIDKKFLSKRQLTNCITEIPQDINLELNEGVLTLKAGSKLYVPNGFESDGTTPKFDVVTIDSDVTYSGGTSGYTGKRYIFYDTVGGNLQTGNHSESGTSNTASATYTVYYHTDDNKIYSCTSNTTLNKTQLGSLPICIVNSVSGGYIIGSIDRVLNGFGFVGSKLFVLPNVKALFADGRNNDGSYKNNEYTFSNVAISVDINTGATPRTITISPNSIGYMTSSFYLIGNKEDIPATVASTGRYRYYAVDENILYTTNGSTTANWTAQQAIPVGGFIGDGTYITDFNLIQMPVKIVDTNDVDGQWITASTNMISSNTTISATTTKEYDLSSYLPNDGFDYEVIVTVDGNTGTSSGNSAVIGIGSSKVATSTNRVVAAITRTSSSAIWSWCGIIPIGGDRKIYLRQIASVACTCDLFSCKAYRRLGRNA